MWELVLCGSVLIGTSAGDTSPGVTMPRYRDFRLWEATAMVRNEYFVTRSPFFISGFTSLNCFRLDLSKIQSGHFPVLSGLYPNDD